jgi:hypothetical protein
MTKVPVNAVEMLVSGLEPHRHKQPKAYRFMLRVAGGSKGTRYGKMVQRRKGSNRHHPVAWRGGKSK